MADADEKDGQAQNETPPSSPESSAEAANNNAKASKDRQCPFCGQPFTSSSLGRHLDLYIKAKNPKPPDGIHDVDEIRRIRGGITRRQPKSNAKNATATNHTPDVRSNAREQQASAHPTIKTQPTQETSNSNSAAASPLSSRPIEVQPAPWQKANWLATGVINDLPPRGSPRETVDHIPAQAQRIADMRNDSRGQRLPRPEYESESMSKLEEAAELGRAAEMALREIMGSLEAAQKKLEPAVMFEECDFFALSFPGLCLAILQPPTTLFSPTPFPSGDSWTIAPPGIRQFESINRALNERSKSKRAHVEIPDSVVFKHHAHLGAAWEHWQNMTEADRIAAWNLQILRSFTRAHERTLQLRTDLEIAEQRVHHLESEFDRLSRCQLPREYLMHPPNTVPITRPILRAATNLPRPNSTNPASDSLHSTHPATAADFDPDTLISRWRATIKAMQRPGRMSFARASRAVLATPPPASTFSSTTHPPPTTTNHHTYPSSTSTPVATNAVSYHPRALPTKGDAGYVPNIRDDIIMSGSVFGVGGPMPREIDLHDLHVNGGSGRNGGGGAGGAGGNGAPGSHAGSGVMYETPEEPGAVVADEDEVDASAGTMVRRGVGIDGMVNSGGVRVGDGFVNGNGKRPLAPDGYDLGSKIHKAVTVETGVM